MYMKQVVKK